MSTKDKDLVNESPKAEESQGEVAAGVETETPVEGAAADEEASNDINVDEEDLDSEDSLTFSNGVIEKIVALAMRDVPGVVGMKGGFINRVQDAFGVRDARKGVMVEVTPDSSVRVNLSVFIAYGVYAPQVFEDVKHAVVDAVSGMTGLDIAGVNLRIEDVLTPEEIEERTPRLPEAEQSASLPEPEIEPEVELAEEDEAERLDAAE
ncbi:MAG: Asp23/Gls24 family envelope stress response protein [Acidobacteriota bacterium]|nr:Asp23/Gls24 family envelope stress response protein [Acidobacteriota bacterium]